MKVSFLIYGLGLLFLFLSDLFISSRFSDAAIAGWALFRSLVAISAVLPLIGLDQVLVRRPSASLQLLRILSIQVPVISCLVGFFLFKTSILPSWWLGSLLAFSSAISYVQFQFFRSHHKKVFSQLSQQGWKILSFLAIALMLLTGSKFDVVYIGVASLLLINLAMALIMFFDQSSDICTQEKFNIRNYYAIGSRYMVTAFILSLSVYAEQIVVNRFGTTDSAALYFSSAAYFLFPMSFINGFIAFLIGPWIRDRHDKFIISLGKHWFIILFTAFIVAGVLNLMGGFLWRQISPSAATENYVLQIIFFLVSFLRLLYSFPSGYFSIFGLPRHYDKLIVMQILFCFPVFMIFFSLQWLGVALIYSVASASLVNWFLKTLMSYRLMSSLNSSRLSS